MRVVLDVQLPGVYLGEVDFDSGTDVKVQLAVSGGHFYTRRCSHRRHQTVIGKQTTSGKPGALPTYCGLKCSRDCWITPSARSALEMSRRCRGRGRSPWSYGRSRPDRSPIRPGLCTRWQTPAARESTADRLCRGRVPGCSALPRSCHSAIRITAESTACKPSPCARQSSTMSVSGFAQPAGHHRNTHGRSRFDAGVARRDGGRS